MEHLAPRKIFEALNIKNGTWSQAGLDFESIIWIGEPQTTKKEWDGKKSELETDHEKKSYRWKRQYPLIGDQLDEIYHKGLDEWKKTIKAVKDAHPKL
jgi:hypothetical protein